MDGIFINSERPQSKKAVKEAVQQDPTSVVVERTSIFHTGPAELPVSELPDGIYPFVGPDPYRRRNFYGALTVAGNIVRVT